MIFFRFLSILILCISSVFLIGFQQHWAWGLLLIGFAVTLLTDPKFRNHIGLIYAMITLLGLTHINTDVGFFHMLSMGIKLGLAVAIPYLITRKIYKSNVIQFPWKGHDCWGYKHWLYVLFTCVVAYLLIPYYLTSTGAYLNWSVELETSFILRLFAGTNGLGIWDELFFINTVFAIFLLFIPFGWANLAQAVLFSSFLYELGFTSWGWVMTFVFAIFQGNVYYRTESLSYVIMIHLLVDLILFLALIHAHYPQYVDIFVT